MGLEAIKYQRGSLRILNQLLLPHVHEYEDITCVQDGWEAIKKMKVNMFTFVQCAIVRVQCMIL